MSDKCCLFMFMWVLPHAAWQGDIIGQRLLLFGSVRIDFLKGAQKSWYFRLTIESLNMVHSHSLMISNRNTNFCGCQLTCYGHNHIQNKLFRTNNSPTPGVWGSTLLPEYNNNGLPYRWVVLTLSSVMTCNTLLHLNNYTNTLLELAASRPSWIWHHQ